MFVVIDLIKDNYVVVADGDLRKIENPKIKNIKHIQWTNIVAEDVRDYLSKGDIPANHVIKKNLKKIREKRETEGKEVW
jgi:ribosomal protein L14E/L6E/L27E